MTTVDATAQAGLVAARGERDTALAVGPANYAGQATAWAGAVRRSGVEGWSFARTTGFSFPVDRRLPARGPALSPRSPVTSPGVAAALDGATHVLLDGYLPLSGGQVAGRLDLDVRELQVQGRRVALVAHGSDIRNPLAHARRVRHSWFRSAGARYAILSAAAVARNALLLKAIDVPRFVSTPDLLHDQPDAVWLPLTVDLSPWAEATPAFEGRLPRVLHAPSRGALKGSDTIDAVLAALAAEGLCEYVRPTPMPHAEFVDLVRSVDVVVDQIRCDAYGTTAVEAMAAGRLVIASVLGTRERVPDDIPIVDATPATLDSVLRRVLADPASGERAAQGPAYVRRWHDGTAAAAALAPFLA